jgi:histidinol-phosphate aminotransferase
MEAFPRLLVVRTFSKVYGLSGLRAGYAMGADAGLLAALAPVLGVNALTQAAVEHALRTADPEIERRRTLVTRERARLIAALRGRGLRVGESEANFVWLEQPGLSGQQLRARLAAHGVLVAAGTPLGEETHVRATIRDAAATDRLVRALS